MFKFIVTTVAAAAIALATTGIEAFAKSPFGGGNGGFKPSSPMGGFKPSGSLGGPLGGPFKIPTSPKFPGPKFPGPVAQLPKLPTGPYKPFPHKVPDICKLNPSACQPGKGPGTGGGSGGGSGGSSGGSKHSGSGWFWGGITIVASDYSGCGYEYYKWQSTGSSYWRHRYYACVS